MKKFLPVITICLSFLSVQAQDEDSLFIRRLADEILVNSKAYENLRVLTKQIGGRLAGSPQMVKAEKWGLKAMQDAGADKAWLQQCLVPHWVRGGTDKATAVFRNRDKNVIKPLDVVALGNSKGTGPKGLSADVIEVKSFDE
ncbi:MAG TPA: peptidase M28 family protein, partial [Flavisolibacter sp.]